MKVISNMVSALIIVLTLIPMVLGYAALVKFLALYLVGA